MPCKATKVLKSPKTSSQSFSTDQLTNLMSLERSKIVCSSLLVESSVVRSAIAKSSKRKTLTILRPNNKLELKNVNNRSLRSRELKTLKLRGYRRQSLTRSKKWLKSATKS